jgi:predicted Zn-dependent protease
MSAVRRTPRSRPLLAGAALALVLASVGAGAGLAADPAKKPKSEGGGVGGFIAGLIKPKMPDTKVITRFDDPAYPKADPNYKAQTTPLGLFGGGGPMPARWQTSATTLQATMDRIVAAGPRKNVPAKVYVVSSNLSNAAATDSGMIVVTTTLLDRLHEMAQEDAEAADDFLVFILAHEYAHVLMRHQQRQEKAYKGYRMLGDVVRTSGTVYTIARAMTVDPKASKDARNRAGVQMLTVMLASKLAGDLLQSEMARAFLPGFAKETERDADLLAVDIAERVGREPVNGAKSLKATQDDNRRRIKEASRAVKEAQKKAAETAKAIVPLLPAAALNGNTDELKRAVIWLAATHALEITMVWLDDRAQLNNIGLHDSPDERLVLVKEYVKTFDDEKAVMPPLKTNFNAIAREIDGKRNFEAARTALVGGDVGAARIAIDKALVSPIGQSPEVRETAGAVAFAEGNYKAAIPHYRAALAAYPGDSLYLRLAEAHRYSGDRAAALKVLAEGKARTGNADAYILPRIDILREAGNKAELEKAVAECKAIGDAELTKTCEEMAKPPEPPKPEAAAKEATADKSATPFDDLFKSVTGLIPGQQQAPAPTPAPAPKPKPKSRLRSPATRRRSSRPRPRRSSR